ncbi:MAG: sec-independent protein translocase protein TatA [Crocinitomix sp.]|jgi:sec-independent protein translocase protein TatA
MENVVYAGMFGPGQITIIVVAVLLLFGGKKIPELMKGMGKGIKGFKDEMNGSGEETKEKSEE